MKRLVTILGPTACGKTPLAVAFAKEIDGEIISADSRQVYKRMDIGTGKDLAEYKDIPYYLIDICEPGSKYTVYNYQHDFLEAYNQICSKDKFPIMCGGSGLYLESILRAYRMSPVPINDTLRKSLEGKTLDELTKILSSYRQLHNTTDTDTKKRAIRAIEIETYYQQYPQDKTDFPQLDSLVIGLDVPREIRREKITLRLKKRLEEGMVEEVQSLLHEGIPAEDLIYYGLEYKYVTEYVIGKISYEEMFRNLEIAIHQFAKRQMTWFRGMERRGIKINWIDYFLSTDEKVSEIKSLLKE
jgi:tRNA dimethylallyltransferase